MNKPKTILTESQRTRLLAGLKHLAPETIQAYVLEQIQDPAELARVEAHLYDCEECLTGYNRAFDASSPHKADFDALRAKLTQTSQELQSSLEPQKGRLAAALESLSSVSGEWKERLLQWRDLLLAAEVHYGASLTAFLLPNGQDSYLQLLPALSAPTLDVVSAGRAQGTRKGSRAASGAESGLVITADEWLTVKVTVEADSVLLEFMDWSESVVPLVVLLPEEEEATGLLPDSIVSTGEGEFEVQFENVPLGAYLLSIAPAMQG